MSDQDCFSCLVERAAWGIMAYVMPYLYVDVLESELALLWAIV